MLKAAHGYTIVEVMLVLVISSVLFIGVAGTFNNRRQGVEFSQAIYDVQSKLNQYASQISSGNFLENTTYTCTQNASSKRPALTLAGGAVASNSNQDCIYLGKMLLPAVGTSNIYSYDVLGLRNIHSGLVDTGQSVQVIADAMPEPAGSWNGGNFTFLSFDTYQIPSGLTILSAKTAGTPGGVLKIYSTLQNNGSSARGITAYSNSYTYHAGDEQTGAETSANVRNCIEEATACTAALPLEANGWTMCLQGFNQTALLTLKPAATGIVTKLNVTSCS